MEGDRAAHKPWSEAEPLLQPLSQTPMQRCNCSAPGQGWGEREGDSTSSFLISMILA